MQDLIFVGSVNLGVGYANETTWSPYRDSLYPGMPNFNDFSSGQENGTIVPTETDVSIRSVGITIRKRIVKSNLYPN